MCLWVDIVCSHTIKVSTGYHKSACTALYAHTSLNGMPRMQLISQIPLSVVNSSWKVTVTQVQCLRKRHSHQSIRQS